MANVVSSLLQWNPENVVVESSSRLAFIDILKSISCMYIIIYRVIQSFEVILSTSAQQAPLNEIQSFTVPLLTILTERVSMIY